jgi:PAS domain S-box-containing protein
MDPSQPESLCDQFFQVSPKLLGFLDRNGHFLKLNFAWSDKTGYAESELLGQYFYDHITAEDRPKAVVSFGEFKTNKQAVSFKTSYDRKDGSKLYVEWQCIGLDPLSPIFLMVYDLTSQKQADKELSESRENYRLLADCVSEGVVLSENGIILEANSAFGRMAWMEPDEVIGKNISVLVPPDHRKRLLDDMLEGADEGYEITGIHKNGTIFPLEVRTRFIEHQGKKIRVNLLRDISDKKAMVERSQAEGAQALKAQEKIFATLTQNARELICIVDEEGRFKYSGGDTQTVLGYEEGENIGRSIFELIHPQDLLHEKKKFNAFRLKPGATETAYSRIKHKNGTWRYMETTAHNLLDEPMVRGVVCNVRDISDRIDAQKKLMESERFHRALTENSLDVVFVHDPDGTLRYVSPSIQAVLGFKPADLMGQNVISLIHPEDQPSVMETLKRISAGEENQARFEKRMRHRNGSWRNVEWIIQNLLQDRVVEGIVVNLRDVTDRIKAETAFRASEARLRGVFNSSSQVFELVDLNGKIVAFNEVARETYRKLFGQVLQLGGYINEYIPLGFKERMPGFLLEAQKEEIHFREVMIRDTEGNEHWFDVSTHPVRDEVGFLVGICLAASWVDERKSSEEKLIHVERLAAIGQVTGAIAHEMRNPLSVILAFSREKADSGDEDASRIFRQAEKLTHLMDDILEFSHRTTLNKETLSAIAILQTSIASARAQAGKSADAVTIRWEGIADDTFVGDRVRLGQVFHNLILNAFQSLSGQGCISICCRRENASLVFVVEDDGPGTPEREMDRFFEPFYTTKKYGSGLGLAISRKIVEDHGGRIEAIGRKPHGMTLKVTIPTSVQAPIESTESYLS